MLLISHGIRSQNFNQTTLDIAPRWDSVAFIINLYASTCFCRLTTHFVNAYSNSFIIQATDFYGRNDLDMVRSPTSIYFFIIRECLQIELSVASVRLAFFFFVVLNGVHSSFKVGMLVSHMKNLNHILRLGP